MTNPLQLANDLRLPKLRQADYVCMAALAALAAGLRAAPGLRIIDDAYITYRYALNLMSGAGFLYNPGERVLGTTTPLYTFLLAGLGWPFPGQALPQVSVALNCIFDAGGVILLYLLAKRLIREDGLPFSLSGLILGALWAVAPRSVTFAIGGMETSLAISLMLAAFTAWLYKRPLLAASLAGLGVLTRPDALIWAGPLALGMIIEHWAEAAPGTPPLRWLPWAELGAFAAVTLPWIIFSSVYFGSPVPQSVAAKASAYTLPEGQALTALLGVYGTPFFEDLTIGTDTPLIVSALMYLFLALLGSWALIRADWRSTPLMVYPWLYLLVFSLANPLIFRWYASPPLPFLFLSFVAGAAALLRPLSPRGSAGRFALAGIGLVWLIFSLRAWVLRPDHGPARPAPDMAWFELELLYQEAATRLRPSLRPGDVVAAGDIGAVGWYTAAPILDTLGLVSPQSAEYYPLPAELVAGAAYAIAPDLIFEAQPDYIITLEIYVRHSLLNDPRFAEAYTVRDSLQTDIYGSQGMLILERITPGDN